MATKIVTTIGKVKQITTRKFIFRACKYIEVLSDTFFGICKGPDHFPLLPISVHRVIENLLDL